ncbi:MAG: type II toxin-antitoxin system RelE/ParE family toxin [Pseudomonadota bacterium]
MSWTVEFSSDDVEAELRALPDDMQQRFARIAELIMAKGLVQVGTPYVKHLQGKLWEMRMTGRDGISRALYVATTGRRVVVVRVFVKKTQKTPAREIEIALKRAKEVL